MSAASVSVFVFVLLLFLGVRSSNMRWICGSARPSAGKRDLVRKTALEKKERKKKKVALSLQEGWGNTYELLARCSATTPGT